MMIDEASGDERRGKEATHTKASGRNKRCIMQEDALSPSPPSCDACDRLLVGASHQAELFHRPRPSSSIYSEK